MRLISGKGKMSEDIELIQRCKEGDLEAFEMLVKKYQNQAVNIAYSLLGCRLDAEDAAQESFIKIYRNIGGFKEESKFFTWLYRIVVNTAYDFLRQKKHTPISLDDDDIKYTLSVLPKETEFQSSQELLNAALAKLPFEYRSVLILREIEGVSYQEIAETLKISIGTVESRLFRGRAMLKGFLLKKGVLK